VPRTLGCPLKQAGESMAPIAVGSHHEAAHDWHVHQASAESRGARPRECRLACKFGSGCTAGSRLGKDCRPCGTETPFEPGNLRSGPRPWPGETNDSRNGGAIQPGEALVTQVLATRTRRRTVSLATRWFGRDQMKRNRSSRWSRRGGQLDDAATVGTSGATAMSTAEPRLEPHVGWSLGRAPSADWEVFR